MDRVSLVIIKGDYLWSFRKLQCLFSECLHEVYANMHNAMLKKGQNRSNVHTSISMHWIIYTCTLAYTAHMQCTTQRCKPDTAFQTHPISWSGDFARCTKLMFSFMASKQTCQSDTSVTSTIMISSYKNSTHARVLSLSPSYSWNIRPWCKARSPKHQGLTL